MLELEFALHLAKTLEAMPKPPPISASSDTDTPIFVFDARACQDLNYRQRGVGLHAHNVLSALKNATGSKGEIVLLLDPTMDPVAPD